MSVHQTRVTLMDAVSTVRTDGTVTVSLGGRETSVEKVSSRMCLRICVLFRLSNCQYICCHVRLLTHTKFDLLTGSWSVPNSHWIMIESAVKPHHHNPWAESLLVPNEHFTTCFHFRVGVFYCGYYCYHGNWMGIGQKACRLQRTFYHQSPFSNWRFPTVVVSS